MPTIQMLNPITHKCWDELILSNEAYSFFHSSYWANVLYEAYGYKPIYFTLLDNDRIIGIIPFMEIKSALTGRRGVSLPFSDYCEPIINSVDKQNYFIESIFEHARKSRWKYIEFRGGEKIFKDKPHSDFYFGHNLDLMPNGEKLLNKFRSSTRRNVKKAVKKGVQIKLSNSLAFLREFYRLHCAKRKQHGVPPQPYYFFKSIYKHILSKNKGILVSGIFENRVIAAAIFFHFGNKALYKYGASDSNYQNLRPNNLIMWKAIKWYSKREYSTLCFGRTEPGNRGLLQFKNGWNTRLSTLRYYRYNFRTEAFKTHNPKKYKFEKIFFQKMPIPLLKNVGLLLYKHVG
jgi:hypothetical protein